jgi:ABC-2 type transport system permease protein
VINALRSEWIKLRTIRMNYVLVIIAIAFPLTVSVLVAALTKDDSFNAQDILDGVNGLSVVTGMLLGVIGASTITGEFGFGTIRPTFAAIPKRSVVIIAKAIITVVVAAVVETVVVLACYLISAAIATSRGRHIDIADAPNGKPAIIGLVVFAAVVAMLGYGLGLLMRSTPPAVAVLLLWPLVAEGLIGALLNAAGVEHPFKWLPYRNGIMLANPSADVHSAEELSRIAGGVYFFAVAAAITVIGALFTSRRDA